jgi:hypothetical protein
MKNSDESSTYIRKLTKNEISSLQRRYEHHYNRTRQGFLSRKVIEILLRKRHFQRSENKSQFFYDIREHAKSAFGDFMLLIETLDDSQLKEIFESIPNQKEIKKFKEISDFNSDTFLNMIKLLFKMCGDDTWRAYLCFYIITIMFEFLKERSFISTRSHIRTLDEAIDAINVEISRNTQIPFDKRLKGFV